MATDGRFDLWRLVIAAVIAGPLTALLLFPLVTETRAGIAFGRHPFVWAMFAGAVAYILTRLVAAIAFAWLAIHRSQVPLHAAVRASIVILVYSTVTWASVRTLFLLSQT